MSITNTSAQELTILDGLPEVSKALEAQGQRELVNSCQLPKQVRAEDKAKLEEWGVVFLNDSEGDPLFQDVTLPDGWKIEPTAHFMWSHLVSETGEVKVEIFYKASFGDRKAFMRV